ncbi:MAG: DNA polymerase III subunit delta [Crocinitomicaceae bacterium]|nr:DNA polymerase III subunit delta [Crocinitomicaceae bacterium]
MEHTKIIKDIQSGKIAPVYLLHGDEPYYIDLISKTIEKNALQDHERDFNEFIFYGKDADIEQVIASAKEFPMMAERKLVVIREAQGLHASTHEKLELYCNNPVSTSVLVLDFKGKKIAKNTKFYKAAAKAGIVFESVGIPDYKIPGWIKDYCNGKNLKIDDKSTFLLSENLGTDLSRIVNELEKLTIIVDDGHTITPEIIEENIGISKDYNFFELSNAIAERNAEKASRIVYYFEKNPKAGPLTVIISNIFGTFEKILRIHFLKDKSTNVVMSSLRVPQFIAKKYMSAASFYNMKKCAHNIEILIEYEKKSKGVDGTTMKHEELKEMIFRLMH